MEWATETKSYSSEAAQQDQVVTRALFHRDPGSIPSLTSGWPLGSTVPCLHLQHPSLSLSLLSEEIPPSFLHSIFLDTSQIATGLILLSCDLILTTHISSDPVSG